MKNTHRFLFFGLLWAIVFPSYPAVALEMIDIQVEKSIERVVLSLPALSPHKVFTVSNPERLVVDVPSIPNQSPISLPASYSGKLVKGVRFGQFDSNTSRFVFDLAGPVTISRISPNVRKKQIAIEIEAGVKSKAVKPAKAAAPKKRPKPVIVIDAGHGGVDPGTIGPQGTQEKKIVLQYAQALRAKLLKTGRYKVVMTRSEDKFIMLRKRVALAREAKGSVFISLHADSAPEAARGLSIYTVSEKASDQEAEALAARENKADVLAGVDLSEERNDVAGILISLAQRETKNRSATLADFLVTRLDDKVALLENTHRFAGFAVLKAPDIPSVLIEIGFLSHRAEEKLLRSRTHREKVISGIVSGLDAYFNHMRQMEGE